MVCVPVYAVCEVFFLFFASSSIQPWDLHRGGREEGAKEAEEEVEEGGVFLKGEKIVYRYEKTDVGERNGRGTEQAAESVWREER